MLRRSMKNTTTMYLSYVFLKTEYISRFQFIYFIHFHFLYYLQKLLAQIEDLYLKIFALSLNESVTEVIEKLPVSMENSVVHAQT